MTKPKILAVSLLSLLAAACSNDPAPAPSSSGQRVSTQGAVRVHGDIVPTRLAPITIPRPTETKLISGSDALSTRAPFALESFPVASPQRDFRRTMRGTDPSAFTFPLDAPYGARVVIRGLDASVSLTTVHVVDAASGRRLDMARDQSSLRGIGQTFGGSPSATPNWDAKRTAPAWVPTQPQTGTPIDAAPTREPFAGNLAQTTRTLSVDVASTPGLARLELPAEAMASGVFVEVQQPSSAIGLAGAPAELNYGYGERAEVRLALTDGANGIDGATLTGWAELPNHARGPDLQFAALGNGQYSASIPLEFLDRPHMGAWIVRATASGQSSGVAFERNVEMAFGYYPAHAHMTGVGTPVITRGAGGQIEEVSVDVDVETLQEDRFGVRGTLTFVGADGQEHALAQAQTGQLLPAGNGTVTLRFSADAMALARADGPFMVRDLALVSHSNGFTQHRLGRGLDIATGKIAAAEIRYPTTISHGAQDLVENGDLRR